MTNLTRLTFCGGLANKSRLLQQNPNLVAELLQKPGPNVACLCFDGRSFESVEGKNGPQPVIYTGKDVAELCQNAVNAVFLGCDNSGTFWLACEPSAQTYIARTCGLRSLTAFVDNATAAILAAAQALLVWHDSVGFCGWCGAQTKAITSGSARKCTNPACARVRFPRLEPAIIVAVKSPDNKKLLLGRRADWKQPVYSTLAGFVEAGESLEEAVVREVNEEAGATVARVDYFASQPWPFPASLMLGFTATAVSYSIQPDGDELDDVRWFDRAELAKFGEREDESKPFRFPSTISISRALINNFIHNI